MRKKIMYIFKIGLVKVLIDLGFFFLKIGLRFLNGCLFKVYSYWGFIINYKNISCDVFVIINMVVIV